MRIPTALVRQLHSSAFDQLKLSTVEQPQQRALQLRSVNDAFVSQPKPGVNLNVPQHDQGDTNACGTTSLAMIRSFFGMPTTHQQIDRDIRAVDIGTAPDNLVSWAEAHGMKASLKNEASLDDITRMLDQGIPPMALIDPGGSGDFLSHYVVVSGYERGADGKVSKLHITDPEGQKYSMTPEEFTKQWSNIKYKGVESGDNRLLLTFAPKNSKVDLPSSSLGAELRNQTSRGLIDGAGDFLNGIKNGRAGDVLGGALETLGNVPAFLLGKIPLPGFKELGGLVSKGVDFVAEKVKKVGNAISSGVKAVGKGIVNGAKKVGKAVKNFFKSIF